VYSELTTDHPIDLVRYRWRTATGARGAWIIPAAGNHPAKDALHRPCAPRDQQARRRMA